MGSDLKRSIFLSANALVGHSEFDPKASSLRVLIVSMNFMYLILISAYTANLASFLVIESSSRIVINQFQDVLNAQEPICVQRGIAYVDAIQKKYPESKNLMVEFETEQEMFQGLHEDKCLVLLTSMEDWKSKKRDKNYNINCSMKWVGRRVELVPASFALRASIDQCRTLLHDVIDFHLIQMKSDDVVQAIWNKYRDLKIDNTCNISDEKGSESSEDSTQLNVMNMAGIFILHVSVIACTTLIEVLLFLNSPKENKKDLKNDLSQRTKECFGNICPTNKKKNNTEE